MRTTVKLYTAIGLAAAMACNGATGSEDQKDLDRAESLRSELAGSGLSNATGVVSAIEVPPNAELTLARTGTPDKSSNALGAAANAGTSAVANVSRGTSDVAAAINSRDDSLSINSRVGTIKLAKPSLSVMRPAATTSNSPAPAAIPTPRSLPTEPWLAGTREGDDAGKPDDGTPADTRLPPMEPPTIDRTRPRPEPEPPSIIRGGPTRTTIDPCAKHPPLPGGGSVLINDRVPPRSGSAPISPRPVTVAQPPTSRTGGVRIRG